MKESTLFRVEPALYRFVHLMLPPMYPLTISSTALFAARSVCAADASLFSRYDTLLDMRHIHREVRFLAVGCYIIVHTKGTDVLFC